MGWITNIIRKGKGIGIRIRIRIRKKIGDVNMYYKKKCMIF